MRSNKRKTFLKYGFVWLVALILLAVALRSVSLTAVWAALRQLTMAKIGGLLLANGVVLLLLNGRWWLLLAGMGVRVPYLRLTAHRLAGYGVSYFTPGPQFGGEPAQVWLLENRHGVVRPAAVASVTLDKALELTVNFAFLLLGLLASWRVGWLVGGISWVGLAIPLLLLLLPITFLLSAWWDWRPFTRWLRWGLRWSFLGRSERYRGLLTAVQASEQQVARFCRQSPGWLLAALLISLLGWLSLVAEYWLMLSFLGVALPFWPLIAAMTAARLALLMPLPGGLGTLEVSQTWALTALGMVPALGISLVVLIRVRDILVGGLGLLWLSLQAKTAKGQAKT